MSDQAAPIPVRSGEDALLFERTGRVGDNSRLVSFLYELIRDHLTPGVVESLVRASPAGTTTYTNGHIARYARDVADRLTGTEVMSEAHCNDPPAPVCSAQGCTVPSAASFNGKPYCTRCFQIVTNEMIVANRTAKPVFHEPVRCTSCCSLLERDDVKPGDVYSYCKTCWRRVQSIGREGVPCPKT